MFAPTGQSRVGGGALEQKIQKPVPYYVTNLTLVGTGVAVQENIAKGTTDQRVEFISQNLN